MTHRTLIARIPLKDIDPDDIITQIENGDIDPTDLMIERENDVQFALEVN